MTVVERLTKGELAAHFGVSVETVRKWRRRGCPAEKGPRGVLGFDVKEVQVWHAATGFVPGLKGKMGGRVSAARGRRRNGMEPGGKGASGSARKAPKAPKKSKRKTKKPAKPKKTKTAKKSKSKGTSKKKAAEAGRSLERTLAGIFEAEELVRGQVLKALGATEGDDLALLLPGLGQTWEKLLKELRQHVAALREEQVKRGELIPATEHVNQMTQLAAVLRSAVERFPTDVAGVLTTGLAEAGIEMADLAQFERCLFSASEKVTDEWLRELAGKIRQEATV